MTARFGRSNEGNGTLARVALTGPSHESGDIFELGVSDLLGTYGADYTPNVRRDGLEIFFASTRPLSYSDREIYVLHRLSINEPWSSDRLRAIQSISTPRARCPAREAEYARSTDQRMKNA